jgi:hypothetical protein
MIKGYLHDERPICGLFFFVATFFIFVTASADPFEDCINDLGCRSEKSPPIPQGRPTTPDPQCGKDPVSCYEVCVLLPLNGKPVDIHSYWQRDQHAKWDEYNSDTDCNTKIGYCNWVGPPETTRSANNVKVCRTAKNWSPYASRRAAMIVYFGF